MAFRRNKKLAKKPYKKRATKRTARVGVAVKQYVKRALAKEIENKESYIYAANVGIGSNPSTAPVMSRLTPTISQGLGKSQRIGNEVIVKSGYVKGYLNLKPYNSLTNPYLGPIFVKMWLVSCKATNSSNLSDTDITNTFFDVNNANVGFQANMLDMLFRINKERWTLHASKTVKIGFSTIRTADAGASGTADNSPFSVPFSFNIGKHLGRLKFEDAGNIPTNKNLWIVYSCANADGTVGSAVETPAEIHYVYNWNYTDA